MADAQRHLVVLVAQQPHLDVDRALVHLFRFLTTQRRHTVQTGPVATHLSCDTSRILGDPDLEELHGLVEAAEVAVVLGRLHVALAERVPGQRQRLKVKVVGLAQQLLARRLELRVDGDLLQDQRCNTIDLLRASSR